MHRSSSRAGWYVSGCLVAAAVCASEAAAEPPPKAEPELPAAAPAAPPPASAPAPSAAKPDAAPSTPPPSAAPTSPPPGSPPPSAAPASPPPPAAFGTPDQPPTLPPPGAPPPPDAPYPGVVPPPPPPPPPPRYGRLGGEPEPEIEPGTWDPWAHAVPGRFSHDGFFLRLNLGPSYARVSRPGVHWDGLAAAMGISIGGSPIENLALHVNFNGTFLANPTEHVGGRHNDFGSDIVFESIGLGATYYFMPFNIYASAGAGLGVLEFEDGDGASKETDVGLTLTAQLGKEWWVGSDWGIGLAGQVLYMGVGDYVDGRRMDGLSLNLLFSATYN